MVAASILTVVLSAVLAQCASVAHDGANSLEAGGVGKAVPQPYVRRQHIHVLPRGQVLATSVSDSEVAQAEKYDRLAAQRYVTGPVHATSSRVDAHQKTETPGVGGIHTETNYHASLTFLVQVILLIVVVESIAVVFFESFHRRWANVDIGKPLPAYEEQPHTPLRNMFAGMPFLTAPYFGSPAGRTGRICVVAILSLNLLGLFLSWVHNIWQKEWWDLFNKSDAQRFPKLMRAFAILVVAYVFNEVYSQYITSWLYIEWREFMTNRLLKKWLSCHTHFHIQLSSGTGGGAAGSQAQGERMDNPDQRIQEDVHLFVSSALDIVPAFLKSLGNLLVFVPVVLRMEPKKAFGSFELRGWLIYFAVCYAAMGAVSAHVIGWSMIRVSYTRQRLEADFRHHALHIHDNAESVALYNAEATEEEHMREHFERIKILQWRSMDVMKRFTIFNSAYGFVQFLVPFFILAPSYFRKEITLGDLFQLTGAIGNVAVALDWFINVYMPLTEWRATSNRLLSFEKTIDAVQSQAAHLVSTVSLEGQSSQEEVTEGAGVIGEGGNAASWLRVSIAEVRLPSGEPIWRDVLMELPRGHRVLISGPEGCGKSILFKALAGVWPLVEGSDVRLPIEDSSQVLFVPQRPALPKRCSLAQALAYPEPRAAYNDETLREALRDVGLEELELQWGTGASEINSATASTRSSSGESGSETITSTSLHAGGAGSDGGAGSTAGTTGGFEFEENWTLRLSPGQQQRLAIGHVLLRRPQVLFLDEATSNVGKQAALELYNMLMEKLPEGTAIVSISHDVDVLAPLHDTHLTVEGQGASKELRTLQRGKRSMGFTAKGHGA
mmetsp:Transcript_75634/g.162178  ORF Transcript_75634/g.162178 Transcript_75634/m.162178 type:complete len:837 (+) Transcript_75634:61-2571(+)